MRRWLATVTPLVVCTGLAGVARAQDTSDLQSLLNQQVITTASTTAQKASVAPALTTTITSEDLQLYGLRTLAEAIQFFGLGVVTSSPLTRPDVGGRGVVFPDDDGKHFLLLVNGHAVNDPLYGIARFDEAAGVPIDLVDHIEIVVGPGSVLYGSNAMMGVVNVITKSASQYRGGHALAEVGLGPRVRAAAGAGFTFALFGAPSEVTAGFQYDRRRAEPTYPLETFPSVVDGTTFTTVFGPGQPANVWGGKTANGLSAQTSSGMIRARSGDFELNIMASIDHRTIPYATPALPVEFDDPDSFEHEQALRLDLRHQATISPLVQLTSRVYGDAFERKRRVDVPGQLAARSQPFVALYDVGVARWVGIEERATLNWLPEWNFVTTLGVDARERWATAKGDVFDPRTGAYLDPSIGHLEVSSLLVAPYVQQTYTPATWLDFNLGARLDDDSRYSPVLSPRAAVALRPWDKSSLHLVYSQAFRAPTWSETSLTTYQTAPSDAVQPEHVRSAEASFEQRLDTQRILFGVFRTWWDNLIESTALSDAERTRLQIAGRIPPVVGNLGQYKNVASIDNYGWNAAWDGTAAEGRIRYGANVTGAFTRRNSGAVSAPLAIAPELFGNAHIAYVHDGVLPTPALAVSLLGPRPPDRLSPTGATLPDAPALADVSLTLTGPIPALTGLSYRASGEYVTAGRGPYSAGPDLSFEIANGSALPPVEFAPIDQFRFFVGLRYDFATGSRGSETRTVP